MTTQPDTRRVRISGDGTHANTTITDVATGDRIGPVVRYTITQQRHELAQAVIEVVHPQVDIECDATIVPAKADIGEAFEHFLSYSGLHAESDDVKGKLRQAFEAAL